MSSASRSRARDWGNPLQPVQKSNGKMCQIKNSIKSGNHLQELMLRPLSPALFQGLDSGLACVCHQPSTFKTDFAAAKPLLIVVALFDRHQ